MDLKDQGNLLYKKGKYGAAIDKYTEAIVMQPEVSTFYTNRALCYLKKGDWNKIISDCTRAIELDSDNIKGFYLLGVAFCRQSKWKEGIEALEQALGSSIISTKSKQFRRDIRTEILRAKKAEWTLQHEQKQEEFHELETQLTCAVSTYESPLLMDRLHDLFNQTKDQRQNFQLPEYFCCSISMDLMTDPVVTPNGISYERHWIEKHIRSNGPIDPVTRKQLTIEMLRPNVALRAAIDDFLDQNPWAFEH